MKKPVQPVEPEKTKNIVEVLYLASSTNVFNSKIHNNPDYNYTRNMRDEFSSYCKVQIKDFSDDAYIDFVNHSEKFSYYIFDKEENQLINCYITSSQYDMDDDDVWYWGVFKDGKIENENYQRQLNNYNKSMEKYQENLLKYNDWLENGKPIEDKKKEEKAKKAKIKELEDLKKKQRKLEKELSKD